MAKVDLREKLTAPFDPSQIEWRVQQAGTSQDGSVWCMVLAFVDARALQNRLDEVFTPFGWSDAYTPYGDDFICTLTVEVEGKLVSKQNGASKTQVEGFKGGISNSFKRVCASGYGIGRYLYDLDTMFAETSSTKQSGDNWVQASFKDKKTNQFVKYWYKKPQLPEFAKPKINEDEVLELEGMITQKGGDKTALMMHFGVSKLSQMTPNQYDMAISMLKKKKDA
jgi:hypothetical protein